MMMMMMTMMMVMISITWDICLHMFQLAANTFEAVCTGAHWLMLTLKCCWWSWWSWWRWWRRWQRWWWERCYLVKWLQQHRLQSWDNNQPYTQTLLTCMIIVMIIVMIMFMIIMIITIMMIIICLANTLCFNGVVVIIIIIIMIIMITIMIIIRSWSSWLSWWSILFLW